MILRTAEVGFAADAARKPFMGDAREYPGFQEYLVLSSARVNDKPQIVEEHDGWARVFGRPRGHGVAIVSDAFANGSGDRIKLLRLRPEPKRVPIGILSRRGKLSPGGGEVLPMRTRCTEDARLSYDRGRLARLFF